MEAKKVNNFHPACDCPVRNILDRLGDKWSLLVMMSLDSNGIMRFSDLQRSISDISQRMLTVTLRCLESDGLVSRTVYPEIPPRVEYALTETGRSLIPYVDALVGWAVENMPVIMEKRHASSVRNS